LVEITGLDVCSEKTEKGDRKDQAEVHKEPAPRKGKRKGLFIPPFSKPGNDEEETPSEDDQAHPRKTSVELIKIVEGEAGKKIPDHTLNTLICFGIHVSHFPEKILMELDEDIKDRCQRKAQHHIPAKESLHSFDQEKSGIAEPDTHPQLVDERRNDKCGCGQSLVLAFLFEKSPVKKIDARKSHQLERGEVEVDTPVLCHPHAQGKNYGRTQTDSPVEQPFSKKIDHGNERHSTENADQPEVEHSESEDPGKKSRNIRIQNRFVIDVSGGEERITQLQYFLSGKIVETLIHPEREGIQGLDEEEKDQEAKQSEAHPGPEVGFLLNSFEQNGVQKLVLAPAGLTLFFISGRLVGFELSHRVDPHLVSGEIDPRDDLRQKTGHDELESQDHQEHSEDQISQIVPDRPPEGIKSHGQDERDGESDSSENHSDQSEKLQRPVDEADDEFDGDQVEEHPADAR